MRIVRALPYVVSAISLAIAVSSWCYVLELDRREHISTRAEAARAELARIERRDADVKDLIVLAQLQRERLDKLTASLRQTRIDVNTVAIGSENLQAKLEARINAVVEAAAHDVTALQDQINSAPSRVSSSSTRDALLRGFAEQMGRNMATPPSLSRRSSPYLDEFEREMARQAARPYSPSS